MLLALDLQKLSATINDHFFFKSPVSATLTPPVPTLPLLNRPSSPSMVASLLSGELVLLGPRLASVACLMSGDGGCLSSSPVAQGAFVSSPLGGLFGSGRFGIPTGAGYTGG